MNQDHRDFLKRLRDAPPPRAIDAIVEEAEHKPHRDNELRDHEQWARQAWDRALDAIIYA